MNARHHFPVWVILGAISTGIVTAVLPACQLDPLRIQHFDDAGGWTDAQPVPDGQHQDVQQDLVPGADLMSHDACIAQPEICNNVDDNCNGLVDEGYNKTSDPLYCDGCKGCMNLYQKGAYPKCEQGACAILDCFESYMDMDGDPTNGCEYFCIDTGSEICDGLDNNCNGTKDEGVAPPQNSCKNMGECAGAQPVCMGATGWQCTYSAAVELRPCTKHEDCGQGFVCDTSRGVCPNVIASDEKRCDGKDGDCDNKIDDPWTNPTLASALGNPCDPTKPCTQNSDCGGGGSLCINNLCTPKLGICRDEGQYVCDPATLANTTCMLKKPGQTPGIEVCNGIDDNCDGQVDNSVTDEAWVTVTTSSTFKIFKYEASRPDATASSAGILSTGRPCSVPGRLPWTQVAKEAAQTACTRAGAKLCTTSQWEQACAGLAGTTFPYGNTYDPNTCNGRAYDTDPAQAGNQDQALVVDQPATCLSNWGGDGLLNMSGNVKEWTAVGFSGSNPTGYDIKGGAYDTPSIDGFGDGLSCTYDLPAPSANLHLPTLGFRCCK